MTWRIQAFFVGRPLWLTIPVIVAVSIASSVGALFLLVELLGHGYGPTFGRSLTIAIAAPTLVSAPIGGYIVHLLREVDRARQHAQAQAWHDALTGLLNRRRLVELGERELAIAHRGKRVVSAALIDIDDFKRINDEHGHAAGDAVLQAVAAAIRSRLRTTDLVGRWGGEEFAVFLPDTDADAAALAAERVRAAVEQVVLALGTGRTGRCTVSIGVSHAHADDDFDRWLDRADRAMYQAKAAGKNRVHALTGPKPVAQSPQPVSAARSA
jgi:diguanylate cyclase (GGDEF)-like protein